MAYATRSVTSAPLRYLPNGMAMKEVEPHEDDGKFYTLEKVYGTRLTADRRYYLVKFHGCDVLYWLAASCCTGIPASLRAFKKAMGWTQISKEKNTEFVLPECLKKPTEESPEAAPATSTGPSTKPTRKRRAASAPRPAKRRSLSPTATDGPSPPATGVEPAPPTVEEASVCDGPKEALACQVSFKGQLLPRFDIAPYVDAFKRGVLPGARRDIVVSLEDVFAGCTKRMTINSDAFTQSIDIRVAPGTLAGHQWVYPLPDGNTITFTLQDAPHARFRRDGSDLVYTHRLPLRDALLAPRVDVELFTGEVVQMEFDGAVFAGMTKRIAGYGMPLPTKPWKRGDLVVEFDVEFPDTVLDEYHEAIKKLL